MSFFNSIFQDARSPIQQRTTLRSLTYLSFAMMAIACSYPYIQGMSEKRDRVMARQLANTTQVEAIEQQQRDMEAANKVFQAEIEAKRKRKAALDKIGIGFVDGEIKSGEPVLLQNQPGKIAPDNSVFENMEGDRAVIRNGKAVIIKKGGK